MASTLYQSPPALPRRASAKIQARRVLLLARFLTAATAVLCFIGHASIVVILRMHPAPHLHAMLDAYLLDLRVWVGIFLSWMGVVSAARRPLRLDA